MFYESKHDHVKRCDSGQISGQDVQGVGLGGVDSVGSEILELSLGLLEVLEVDRDSHTEVAGVDIVLTVLVHDVGACLQDVGGVLELFGVDSGAA